jgi:hypothetical protein
MHAMKQDAYILRMILRFSLIWIVTILPLSIEAQSVIPVPAHGSNFLGNSRGFWFAAPCDFKLTGVRAPADYSIGAQTIHVIKFNAAPASYPSTTTVFTTLYYGSGITDTCYVDLDIQVLAGDVIGVLAVRNDGSGISLTSYTTANSPITSAIGPYSVNLTRLGVQENIINNPGSAYWTEPGNPIGRALIRYELPPASIPIPAPSSTFTGNARGCWFTSPCDFLLTGIRAPHDYNSNAQTIHLVKFPSAPTAYPTVTTTFTTLYYGANMNDTGYVKVNIQIYAGDIIGVMAVRDNGLGQGQTSYSTGNAPISSTIGSHSISLQRLGYQGSILTGPALNFWTETGLPVGRVEMRYETPSIYRYSPGGLIANSFPFWEPPTGNNKRQWLYHHSDFVCPPMGYINTIYLKSSSNIQSQITDMLVRMGVSTLTTLSGTSFVTALDTLLYAPSISINSIGENLIPFELERPFFYDGASSFVVEVSHQGTSPGFQIMQATLAGRSMYGNSGSPNGILQDRLAYFGFEIVTDYTDAALQSFSAPGGPNCEGINPVTVNLKNISADPLIAVDIHLEIKGVPQPVYQWTGNLLPGASTVVLLGSYPFLAGQSPYNLKAWVSAPNSVPDFYPFNDTIIIPNLVIYPPASVVLGPDVTLKANGTVVLNAGAGFTSYSWSTGATTQTIQVDSAGTGIGTKIVWVNVMNASGCFGSDTIKVIFIDDSGIEDEQGVAGLHIAPNPNDGRFMMTLNGTVSGACIVQVVGMDGKVVRAFNLPQLQSDAQVSFDLSDLPAGMYMLKLSSDKGMVTRRFVIRR